MNFFLVFLTFSVVLSFTELYELDGFSDCVRLIDYFDQDTAWYNCTGRMIGYSDFSDVTDDEYLASPLNADYNKTTGKFSTFDEFTEEDTDNILAESSLTTSFIEWASSTVGKAVKNLQVSFNRKFLTFGEFAEVDNGNNLAKRTKVRICGHNIAENVCSSLTTSFIEWASSAIGKAVKNLPVHMTPTELVRHNGSGHIIHINVGENLTNVGGDACDTTAQWDTITGAVEKWIKNHEHLCGQWCMNLAHGGKWQGFISLGVGQLAINPGECENKGSYGGCQSGGKND